MALQQKLDEYKAKFESSTPKATVETMHRATKELRDSGLVERALKAGEQAPGFTLTNQEGKERASAELLAKGPLVITFFRGHW